MPERGAIYFVEVPGDPHQRPAPVVVVSTEARNRYGRDVLAIPLSTSPKRFESHLELEPGETGLPHRSIAKCENIGVVEIMCSKAGNPSRRAASPKPASGRWRTLSRSPWASSADSGAHRQRLSTC